MTRDKVVLPAWKATAQCVDTRTGEVYVSVTALLGNLYKAQAAPEQHPVSAQFARLLAERLESLR